MGNSAPNISLYDTLTRSKRPFVPIDEKNVGIYVCGPTVYDFAHIGNARPVIVFDVLFRFLQHIYGENHVMYVRNITDVDDKINARALRDFPDLPLNKAIRKVTEKTAARFQKDSEVLGCLTPTQQPRATENIGGMITLIKDLIAKEHAYVSEGEVLFSVASMPDYGKLANRKLEDQKAGARVEIKSHKRDAGDFVLWKLSSENEPGWPSPWGRGRPGWHIECSAMSERYLGKTFDIHGGGLDLIFPHHENEIAQSRCSHGTDAMANYWMHNGFLQVEGQKMSKSVGNFFTIQDLMETEIFGDRKWPGEVLRLAMLMTNYREPIDFCIKRLEDAQNIIVSWNKVAKVEAVEKGEIGNDVLSALENDLNTPMAVAALQRLAKEALQSDEARLLFLRSAQMLGLRNPPYHFQEIVEVSDEKRQHIDIEIAKRLELIAAKNWGAADAIRDVLLADGVILKDGKNGETGERTTMWEVK